MPPDLQRPSRVRPSDAPDDAVERIARPHRIAPATGDVMVYREAAATRLTPSMWRYCVDIFGDPAPPQYFARYDAATIEGNAMALRLKVCLIYVEDNHNFTLLTSYRASASASFDERHADQTS